MPWYKRLLLLHLPADLAAALWIRRLGYVAVLPAVIVTDSVFGLEAMTVAQKAVILLWLMVGAWVGYAECDVKTCQDETA